MVKKGFRVIMIQLSGLLLSLISMYVLVGGMDPIIYSLVGVYNTILSLVITFTQVGIGTVLSRNALYWIESKQKNIIQEYYTQAIISRCLMFVILLPILIGYLCYLNISKYNTQYTKLFIFFIVSLFSKSLIDCIRISLKALGKYEISQIIDISNQTVLKFVGIIVFLKYGSIAYLYVFSVLPIFIATLLLFYTRRLFDFNKIDLMSIWKKAKSSRYLLLRGYLDYFRQSVDSLLVSIFFSPAIMGSYSVFKTIEQMCKSLVEGFFDVITQEIIRIKGNAKKMYQYEKKINCIRNICLVIGIIGLGLFYLFKDRIIYVCRLTNYKYIDVMIISVIIIEIVYIWGKIEINLTSLLADPKEYFSLGIIVFIFSLATYFVVIIMNNLYIVLAQRILITIINSLSCSIYYRIKKKKIFELSSNIL